MTNFIKCVLFTAMFVFALSASSQTRDGESKLNIQHVGHHGDHSQYYPPDDMPEVYLDSDEMEIISVADGFSSYYDVLIIRNSTNQTMVSTQISGYGDSIDISSLPSDNYIIVITSEFNNVFQGNFTIL